MNFQSGRLFEQKPNNRKVRLCLKEAVTITVSQSYINRTYLVFASMLWIFEKMYFRKERQSKGGIELLFIVFGITEFPARDVCGTKYDNVFVLSAGV